MVKPNKSKSSSNLVAGKYSFEDLINLDELKEIMQNFSQLTGVSITLTTHPHQKLLLNIGQKEVCSKFHRQHKDSEAKCVESNFELTKNFKKVQEFNIHHCKNGIISGATPIIIDGVHMANLFTGQVFIKNPNENKFIKQAQQYQYDTESYLKAIKEVPITNKTKIKETLKFLSSISISLADKGLSKLREEELIEQNTFVTENTLDVIFIINKDGRILYINNSVTSMLGYSIDELIGHFYSDFVDPNAQEDFNKNIKKIFNENVPRYFRSQIRPKNKSVIKEVEINAKIIKYKNQELILGNLRDITERIDSEYKNKLLLHAIPELIFIFDKKGFFKDYITSENKPHLFVPKEKFIGKNVSEIMPKEVAKRTQKSLNILFKTKKPQRIFYSIPKDNKIFYFEASLSILDTTRAIAVIRDITIRREAKIALKELSLKQAHLLEAIPDIILEADSNRIYTYANTEAYRFFGIDIIGKKIDHYFIKEEKVKTIKGFSFRTNKDITYTESYQRRQDGEIRLLAWWCKVQKNKKGEIIKSISTARDVTEQRKIQGNLKESESLFRNLTEASTFGVVIYDKDNLIFVNKAAEKITGFKSEELKKLKIWDLIHPVDKDLIKEKILKSISNRRIIEQLEFRFKQKNGQSRWILFSSKNTKWNNKDVSIASFTDINKKKKAELEILDSENRYKALANTTSEAIFFSIDHKFLDCNKIALNMFGYTYEEAQNLKPTDIVTPEYHQILKDHIERNKTSSYIVKALRKDGSTFWAEIRGKNMIYQYRNVRISAIKDIDAYVVSQNLLEKSEEKYRTVTESLSECVFTVDLNGYYTYLSPVFEKITNRKVKDFIGKFILEGIHPSQHDYILRKFRNTENILTTQTYDINILTDDNQKVPLEVNIKPLFDKHGNLIGHVGTFKDISKRKKAEQKLQQREQYFRQIFENQEVIKLIIDPETGVIDKANLAAEKFYGWSIKELERMNITQINISSNIEIRNKIKKTLELKQNHFESEHLKANGTKANVEIYTSIINIDEKQYIYSIIIDISKQKQTLNQLHKLNSAINQSTSIVVITDKNGTIEYVNPIFIESTGYSIDEVIGKNPRILKSGFHSDEFYQNLWETLSVGKTWKGEFQNKTKNGKLFWESAVISPIFDKQNEITNYLAVKDNITEKKKMEEALVLAKEKAEESDRLKTSFLQNMSHEIRTPLNSILGFSQLLQDTKTDNPRVLKFSSIINNSGQRLLELINNILDISKIEAGSVKINQEAIHLNTLLKHVKDVVQLKADEKQLEIIMNMPWDEGESLIQTDAGKLNQILLNLINNAIKFTKSGNVTCSYELINDDFLEFKVSDTGIGIPKQKQKQIFQRFFQVDQSISRNFEGAGLGLSITKALVNLLGGEIRFESEYRKGTTFYFTLPYKGRKRKSKVISSVPKLESKKELKVLIAEDDMASFLFLETVLLDFNVKITHAQNGREAVKFAKENRFNFILMDINMPILNGLEATEIIRSFDKETPIIAQTAFAFAVEEKKVFEAGCNAYLAKPVSKIKLLKTISKFITTK